MQIIEYFKGGSTMQIKISFSRKLFLSFNYIFIVAVALICLLPLINILSVSFSTNIAASSGLVKLLPVDFNLKSYAYAIGKPEFLGSFFISIERVLLGVSIQMLLTILSAYPLSKDSKEFPMRTFYVWFFFVTMLFNGGLIPWYIAIKNVHLIDSIWALVLPPAVSVYNVVLLLNFFRGVPGEIEEAAFVDGSTYWKTLWRIIVPISKPAIATILLFSFINHWNSWFDGLILMNSTKNYPLQTYLQTIVTNPDPQLMLRASREDQAVLTLISDRTVKSAQIFLAALPILIIYPFLQKYFTKGIILGSVKG